MASQNDPQPRMSVRTVLCGFGALVAMLAMVYGVSATGTYAGAIAQTVHDPAHAAWLSNSAQVVQVIIGPPIALAADLYGRRWFMIVGLTLGMVGAFVTATAHSGSIAILGAVITGLGFATQSLYLAVLSEIAPRSLRPVMQALFNVTSSLGGIFGVVTGGLAIRNGVSTRWIYYVLAILYGIGAAGITLMYRPAQRRPDTSSIVHQKRLRAIDLPGAAFLLCATCPFYFALVSGKNPYPWHSATILASLCIGLAMFAGFVIYEWKGTSEGLLHHALFKKSRNYGLSIALVFVEGIMFFSFNSQWAREISLIMGKPGYEAGLNFLYFWVPSAIATPFIGYFSKRFKEVKIALVLGFLLFLVACIGMATVTPGSWVAVRVYAALAGTAFASPLTLIAVAAQLAAPPQLMAIASVNLLIGRALGGVVSVAVYSAVLKSKFATQLPAALSAIPGLPASAHQAIAGISSLAEPQFGLALSKIPKLNAETRQLITQAVQEAYAKSYRYVWIIAAPFALVAIGLVLVMEPVAPMMTNQIDAPAERIKTAPAAAEEDDSVKA